MKKRSILITLIFIFSTFIQLLSQIFITKFFGAKIDLEIFLAAVSLPTIFVTVIYATLNDAFLPLLGEVKSKKSQEYDRYLTSHVVFLSLISAVIAFILSMIANQISFAFFGERGTDFVNNVAIQMKYMFFSIPLSVIATLLGSHFYFSKKFLRFPFAQAVGSISNLFLILILTPSIGIFALVLAFVVSIAIQILLVVPNLNFSIKIPNLSSLFLAWVPLVIGNFALRSDTLLIRSFATQLPEGYLVYLNLISKIFSLATGVMTIGIQVVLLPHLIEFLVNKNYAKATSYINRAKGWSVIISIVVVILLWFSARIFIHLLFVGGKFSIDDANITASLIPFFIIPAIGWGINSVFFQPLIALKKNIPLAMLNISAIFLAWGVSTIITRQYGALWGISLGLITLLFTGIIGSEILWQIHKKKLLC